MLSYFEQYGYWVVFFGVMLETPASPVPGETIPGGRILRHEGHFHVWEVMAIAARRGAWRQRRLLHRARVGRGTLERYGQYAGLTHARLAHMDRFFPAHGNKTILVARFITGFRVFAALLAGSSRMQWRTFAIYNMLGALLWSFAITLVGFFFGRSWECSSIG